MLDLSGRRGELFRPLSNRTGDGLGMESERKREIEDAARLFVLSNWVNMVAVC